MDTRFTKLAFILIAAALASRSVLAAEPAAEGTPIEPRLVHLRNADPREWSSFSEVPDGAHWEVRFSAAGNPGEYALRLRQQDVKQPWRVLLNGRPLGELIRDEADTVWYLPIAAGVLASGENTLRIETKAKEPDDIRVGQLRIEPRPVQALADATLAIEVVDAKSKSALPARITVVDADGALHATSATSSDHLAARPGVIYSSDGKARFGLPAGKYAVYASRGFEYSLAQAHVSLAAGQTATRRLEIRREVDTSGYVACDTHIHTLTFSGHGDATIAERMITLAGEGIELPIATDHNAHIDYEAHAKRLGVRQHFTPVIGNEVTTPVGHFNVFPVRADARVPDHRHKQWDLTFDEIFATPYVKVAILNHARDLHSGVRPFGPDRFNAIVGENLDGWPMRFNAMEVINSGATQTDPLRLVRDWMALQSRGYQVTPVGSSDSHDVARYIVGQGRTYIRCDDADVAKLDVEAAVANFLQGRVLVSYGLLVELTVNGKFRSGDLAALAGDMVEVDLQVLCPHWVTPTQVHLYANGQLIREEPIAASVERPTGVGWKVAWRIPRPKHDAHLVAVAVGEGIDGPFWPTAKPYQPTSPDWQPRTLGASGAVWLDGDGNGRRSSPRDYAQRAFAKSGGDLEKLAAELAGYDAAVAAQAGQLYVDSGQSPGGEQWERTLKTAEPQVAAGLRSFWEAWRECQIARAQR